MLRAEYDKVRGLVVLADKGFKSLVDEERAAAEVRPLLKTCREEHGDIKLLVICCNQIQREEVMHAAARRASEVHLPHDRVAYVFESSLAKMQAARFFNGANQMCFISENAAVTWLLADRGAARVTAA